MTARPELRPPRWSESPRLVPRRFVQPVRRWMGSTASAAFLVFLCALVAMVWANSSSGAGYDQVWSTEVRLALGPFDALDGLTLREWVTDGAMSVFFFLVAMEVKRELCLGDLRDRRVAALPIGAAIGGMVVPASLYAALSHGGSGSSGWGIPMATDIAFAVAIVMLAGPRVPVGARVFLLTLAVVDDFGAIVVIAIFYSSGLSIGWLILVGGATAATVGLRYVHVRALPPYAVMAFVCWFAMLESGVHPTIAGVIFGFLVPHTPFHSLDDDSEAAGEIWSVGPDAASRAQRLRRIAAETQSPLDRLEVAISPWVNFAILPVFALASAGVVIAPDVIAGPAWRVALGVTVGLVLGKPVGILLVAWVMTRFGWAHLPPGVSWRHLIGVAVCGGVGFTVALFVAGLAFQSDELADAARVGILGGSVVSAVAGFVLLRSAGGRPTYGTHLPAVGPTSVPTLGQPPAT